MSCQGFTVDKALKMTAFYLKTMLTKQNLDFNIEIKIYI